jgi:hypothetical protein
LGPEKSKNRRDDLIVPTVGSGHRVDGSTQILMPGLSRDLIPEIILHCKELKLFGG